MGERRDRIPRTPVPATRPPTNQSGIDGLLAACHRLDFQDNLVVFHIRLALSVVDSASRRTHQGVQNEAAQLATRIQHIGDGYAARDVLAHADCAALLTEDQIAGLAGAMNACALGQGGISAELELNILTALTISEEVILQTLSAQSADHSPAGT